MKTVGIILLVVGIIATLIFGVQAIQESESFSFLGMDIGVSTANWTPVIVSAIILIIGAVMTARGNK